MSRFAVHPPSSMPCVLLAGGAGFLGSHLVEALLHSGARVIVLDDLITGNLDYLAPFRHHPHFLFFEVNVNRGLPPGLLDQPITHVVHAAGVGAHPEDGMLSFASLVTSGFGTKNLLDFALRKHARFLLISSVYVYEGLASSTSLDHYYGAVAEQDAQYASFEAKRYAETLCAAYVREYHLDARVARLSDVYGPRMDITGSALLPHLMRNILAGEDLMVDAEGSQELLLTYVSDVVYGLLKLLFADGEHYQRTIYGFYNPERVSVLSIAYTLKRFLPAGKEILFQGEHQPAYIHKPTVTLERTQHDLGWEPTVDVTDGMTRTIEFFRATPPSMQPHHPSPAQLSTTPPQDIRPRKPHLKPPLPHPPVAKPPAPSARGGGNLPYRGTKPAEVITPVVSSSPTSSRIRVRRPWWRRLFFTSIAILLYLGLGRPLTHGFVYTAVAAWQLHQATGELQHWSFAAAQQDGVRAQQSFLQADSAWMKITTVGQYVGWHSQSLGQVHQLLSGLAYSSKGVSTFAEAALPLASISQAGFSQTQSLDQQLQLATLRVQETRAQFSQANLAFSGTDPHARVAGLSTNQYVVGGFLGGVLQRAQSELAGTQTVLDQQAQLVEALPLLLGTQEDRRYLLAVQDIAQPRPNGGAVVTAAFLHFHQGVLTQVHVDDSAVLDGRLVATGSNSEPAATAVLGSTARPFTDAGFSLDPSLAAHTLATRYNQATGSTVDGVIFISTTSLWRLIATQPRIDHDCTGTVFAQQELGVRGRFVQQCLQNLVAPQPHPLAEIRAGGEIVADAFSSGDLRLVGLEPSIEQSTARLGWSGAWPHQLADQLQVQETSIGSWLDSRQRTTSYHVTVGLQGRLQGTVQASWPTTARGQRFLQIITPPGTRLIGTRQFEGTVQSDELMGHTVFSGTTHSSSVELVYELPVTLPPHALTASQQRQGYSLTWLGQVGFDKEPLLVSLQLPSQMVLSAVTPHGDVVGRSITWRELGTRSVSFQANFAGSGF